MQYFSLSDCQNILTWTINNILDENWSHLSLINHVKRIQVECGSLIDSLEKGTISKETSNTQGKNLLNAYSMLVFRGLQEFDTFKVIPKEYVESISLIYDGTNEMMDANGVMEKIIKGARTISHGIVKMVTLAKESTLDKNLKQNLLQFVQQMKESGSQIAIEANKLQSSPSLVQANLTNLNQAILRLVSITNRITKLLVPQENFLSLLRSLGEQLMNFIETVSSLQDLASSQSNLEKATELIEKITREIGTL